MILSSYNEGISESDVEVMMKKKNTSSQIENLSEVDVTPENVTLSGARALAHLFLLEQDFRQVKTPDQLSKLVVSRLNGFIDYDAILFWVGGKQQKIKIVRISGFDNKLEGKLINEWGMRSAKWLNKLNKSMTEIDHTMIKEYVFDVWPEVFPMQGLYIPIAMPEQKEYWRNVDSPRTRICPSY